MTARDVVWIPEFRGDTHEYCERHRLFPSDLSELICKVSQEPSQWERVDSEIYGLRRFALPAPSGGSELLIAIDYEDFGAPLLVLIGILPCSPSDVGASLTTPEYKRRTNTAIGRMIYAHRTSAVY